MLRTARQTLFCLAALLAPAPALAQSVFLVDDDGGPGVDFTQIQDAVDVAGPLDRIDVGEGSYASVTVTRPVTIMGIGDVWVPRLRVEGVSGGGSVVVSRLRGQDASVVTSDATVLLDRLVVTRVLIDRCRDARIQNADVGVSLTTQIYPGIEVRESFLQVSNSSVHGNQGISGFIFGTPGGAGIYASGPCQLVVAHTRLRGGKGGTYSLPLSSQTFGEKGGPAIDVLDAGTSAVLLDCDLEGGDGGDGSASTGALGGSIEGCDLGLDLTLCRTTTSGNPLFQACVDALPRDDQRPSLKIESGNTPGQPGRLEYTGRAGATLRLYQGSGYRNQSYPTSFIPLLVSARRTALVTLDVAGERADDFTTPPLPRGTRFVLQSTQPILGGGLSLSNSMTLLID